MSENQNKTASTADKFKIPYSAGENAYRERTFGGDFSNLLSLDVRCTICSSDLNWTFLFKKQITMHPILEVLVCEGCLVSLGTTDYASGCLWCGKKSDRDNVKCPDCDAKFCVSCIKLNFGLSEYNRVKLHPASWVCYVCDAVDDIQDFEPHLWGPRAICYAANEFTKDLKKLDENENRANTEDCSICTADFEPITVLQCKHKFHEKCLKQWLQKSRSCPNCRSRYVEEKTD